MLSSFLTNALLILISKIFNNQICNNFLHISTENCKSSIVFLSKIKRGVH